jgi:hypothetical protein
MSFSQEMKDFLAAYQGGQKINASRTDQDYKEQLTKTAKQTYDDNEDPNSVTNQTAQAQLDRLKQSIGQSAQAHADAHAQHVRSMQPAPPVGSGLYPTGAINPGAPGPQPSPGGALPIGPSTMQTGADEYADGGLVPDDEDPEDVPPQNVGAVPINPINQDPRLPAQPTPADASTDVSARRRGLNGVVAPDLVHDATKAGMTYGAKEYGLMNTGAVMTPAQQARARQFAQGHGAMTDEEMNAAKQAVDPEGKLTDSQRNMAALGSVYQFWANKGDGEKASRVAFQMLQHYRNASQRYAAIAAHAAEGGNVDLATKAAMKAYANVPDGNDLELFPNPDGGIMYAVTGPNGDVVSKGIATPQQLAASAMGLATGGFDKAILSAAGQREEAKGAVAGGGKPQTAADRGKEADLVGGEVSKLKDQWAAKNKDQPVDEEHWAALSDTAQHLFQQNPKSTPSEVARAASLLMSPGTKDPDKPDFKITAGEEGGPATIKFGNGKTMQVDDNMVEQIANRRADILRKSWDDTDKKMTDAEAPGFTGKASAALSDISGILGKDFDKFKGELGDVGARAWAALPDEARPRITSALEAAKRAGGDAGSYMLKLITDDLKGDNGITPSKVGRGLSDAAGVIGGALSSGKLPSSGNGAVPVDDAGIPM